MSEKVKKIVAIKHGKKSIQPIVQSFLKRCELDKNISYSIYETQYPKHAIALARNLNQTIDALIVIGGDGTMNEVVNGLLSLNNTPPPILLIGAGTGNDFIRNFHPVNFTQNPLDIFQSIPSNIPIGKIQTENELRYFINIADIGFGGKVVSNLEKVRRITGSRIAYILAILWSFFNYNKKYMRIEFNGMLKEEPFFMIAACLGSTFGDGMIIAPGKKRKDDHFQLVMLGKIKIWHYLFYFGKLRKGKRILHKEVSYNNTNGFSITGIETMLEAEVDGEAIKANSFYVSKANISIPLLNQIIE